ncbi:MAG: hypothetical protein LLF94_02350 [Chlamydiales bacterium]|nr:hypothetical protein [Chlamydiales bacterium]
MSYLSHDVPSDLFLLFQLHSMQKAHEKVKAALPRAEKEQYFNSVTLNLLKNNPTQTIEAHKELCRKVLGSFHEQMQFLPKSANEIKEHLQALKALKTEQATYTFSFFGIGRNDLATLNEKIAKETLILNTIRELLMLTAAPSEKAEIQSKSNEALTEFLLNTDDLSFIFQKKRELEELSRLFNTLQ